MRESINAWEERTFPKHYALLVPPHLRVALTHALGRALGVPVYNVELTLRRNGCGKCFPRARHILLPIPKCTVSVGVITHELAHQYAYEHGYDGHHGQPWRSAMCRLAAFTKPDVPGNPLEKAWAEATAQVQQTAVAQVARAQKVSARLQREAERAAATKAARSTAENRLAQVRARIKRLETKVRGLQTRLKSARRSEAALARVVAARVLRATAPSASEIAAAEARLASDTGTYGGGT